MTSKKVFLGMVGAVIIVTGLSITAIVYGDLSLKKRSTTLLSAKLENASLQEQQLSLIKARKDIEKYKELEQISKTVVTQDKDQVKAVREIVQIAQASGIQLRSISFPASSLGIKATPTPTTGSDDNKAGGAQDKAPTAAPTSPLTQAKPVEGINGVYSLEMNIIPEAGLSYYQFLDFLARLENNRRTAQVTMIKINPISNSLNGGFIDFTLTINIFIKP